MLPLATLRRAGRLLAVLALLALASRLWVPIGFMPAAHAQPLALAICNPQGGSHAVLVDTGHEPATHEGAITCPFCLLLSLGGPAPDLRAETPRYVALALPAVRAPMAAPQPTVAGPPLGQRAPPARA